MSPFNRPKYPISTWSIHSKHLCNSGKWQHQGCDRKSHLGRCQETLWSWQSQPGVPAKWVDTSLCWTAGYESQSSCLDWIEQAGGTELLVYLVNTFLKKEYKKDGKVGYQDKLWCSFLSYSCFQTGGYFRYTDGWHMNFANWAEDEPSSDKPCVYLDADGKWRTAFCNQTMNSVCMQTTGTTMSRVDFYMRYKVEEFF